MQTFLTCDITKPAVLSRVLLNKVLGLLTLGFYRFWGKTHLRRLIWQSVSINGDRLTYHGTAKELFIGFLLAIIVMAVLFGIIGSALKFAVISSPELVGVEQLINIVFLAAFWQFARYRLWRFRLSRTSYRTVRFFQNGSALMYSAKVMLWGIISVITVGWAYPKLRAVQADYQLNNMAFGNQRFEYKGETKAFYRIYFPLVLFANSVFWSVCFLNFATDIFTGLSIAGHTVKIAEAEMGTYLLVFSVLTLVIGGILYVSAKVKEFNYKAEFTTFSNARFSANLPIMKVFKIGLITGVVNILFFVLIGVAAYAGLQDNLAALQVYLVLAFIAYALLYDVIKYLYLFIPMLKLLCQSVAVDNVCVFEEVAASTHKAPTYGEGLADALDVGAF